MYTLIAWIALAVGAALVYTGWAGHQQSVGAAKQFDKDTKQLASCAIARDTAVASNKNLTVQVAALSKEITAQNTKIDRLQKAGDKTKAERDRLESERKATLAQLQADSDKQLAEATKGPVANESCADAMKRQYRDLRALAVREVLFGQSITQPATPPKDELIVK